ncbi:restriction endonuclease subunit S [Neobacillus mesonae]|uniref:restriction endonuclease subunit S n=1 Tax=Neobacillus mesonae TaxID=1193713 RepID=UPI002572E2B9|nr:restriction endonuclease subunit S [Neobacillus mesonae]
MSWCNVKLGDIAEMKYGKMPPKDLQSDEGYPIYSGYRITGYCKDYLFEDSHVVVVARGVGGTGDVKISPEKSWITNLSIVLLHDEAKVDKKFLFYRLGLEPLKDKLNTGAAQAQITINSLKDYEIVIPSLNTQQRIVKVLTAYDDLIQNNLRRISLLENSAKLLYQEWFVRLRFPGFELAKINDDLPEGWLELKAFDVMNVLSGGTPKTTVEEYWDGDIPFYTPKDSQTECYVLETEKTITEYGLSKCNSKLYPKNTIFITARGTVGNLNLSQRPMAMNQSCYALIGKDNIPQFYLYLSIQSAINQFKSRAVGAVFDAIVVDTFKNIPFTLPSKELIFRFEDTVKPLFNNIENLLLQNQKLQQARDLLLPKLMNGEIKV